MRSVNITILQVLRFRNTCVILVTRHRTSGVRDREEGLVLALYERIAFRRFRTNKLQAHLHLSV
jgi:hypothetical protein